MTDVDPGSPWLDARERRFVERLPVPTVLMDLDRQAVVVANAAFCAMLGYTEAEVAAMDGAVVGILAHPDDRERLAVHFAALLASRDGEVLEWDLRTQHAGGEWRWAHTYNRIFDRHPDGRARLMLSMIFDDTERLTAYAEMARTAQALADAQQIGHVGSWTWDPATGAIGWTAEMFRIWGRAPAAGAPDYTQFLDTLPEPDRSDLHRALGEALAGDGTTFRIDHRLCRPDGTLLHIQCRGRIDRDAAGRPMRVSGTSQDVTELKAAMDAVGLSEQRYRLAAAVTTDVLYDYLIDGERVSWNPAMTRVFGHALAADGTTTLAWWADLIHPDDRGRVEASLGAAIASGADRWSDEYRFRCADGRYALVLDRASVMRDATGRANRLIGSMIDETARRALEARVRQTATLDALGTLAGGIAHDFNNVLTGILGFAELAARDMKPGSEGMEMLGNILRASERARDLVQRILAFSRPDDLPRRPVPLAALVDETLPLVRASLPSTLRIDVRIARDPALVIEGDRQLLQQGLVNLCVNAEHATRGRPDPVVVISLAAETLDAGGAGPRALAPGRYARLMVRDNGVGMPAHVLERVFEPFFTTKPVGEGTGLGLALVHGAVTAAGGTVEIESAPNVGTAVSLLLPVQG